MEQFIYSPFQLQGSLAVVTSSEQFGNRKGLQWSNPNNQDFFFTSGGYGDSEHIQLTNKNPRIDIPKELYGFSKGDKIVVSFYVKSSNKGEIKLMINKTHKLAKVKPPTANE